MEGCEVPWRCEQHDKAGVLTSVMLIDSHMIFKVNYIFSGPPYPHPQNKSAVKICDVVQD